MTPGRTLNVVRSLGVTLKVLGDRLHVDAPKGVLTSELRQALVDNKSEIIQALSRRCNCDPMAGPANVGPKHKPCRTCGFTIWCPHCGGCRRCRGEAEGFHMDRAEVKARRDEALGRSLERLRNGHRWLAETHMRLLEERDVYAGMETRFLVALDGWSGMDAMLREVWEYPLCVMGPGKRCPDDSPVACQACVDEALE